MVATGRHNSGADHNDVTAEGQRAKTLDTAAARRRFAAKSEQVDHNEALRIALVESMARHGYSKSDLARFAGFTYQRVEQWTCDRRNDLPTMTQVLCFPAPVRDDVVRKMAELGDGARLQPRIPIRHSTDPARLASVTVEVTDVLRCMSIALADGRVDRAEAETSLQEIREAINVLLEAERRHVELIAESQEGE